MSKKKTLEKCEKSVWGIVEGVGVRGIERSHLEGKGE